MEHEFHRELKATVTAFLQENGWTCYQEYYLPTGKIADILATNHYGKLLITEIKTTIRHYLIHEAYLKYSRCCDVFYVAAPAHELKEQAPPTSLLMWERHIDRPGLLGIEAGRVEILRQACPVAMSPTMRLQVTPRQQAVQLSR